jgi:hypothetical protein
MNFWRCVLDRTWHIFGDVEGDVAGNQIGFGGI